MKIKYCDVGNHEVPVLFHSRKPDRPSCCLGCYRKTTSTTRDNPSSSVSIQKEKKVSVKRANEATDSKSIPDLLKLAQIVFNKWIRNRDLIRNEYFWCISCGKEKRPEVMQAGHFMPSTYSSLRHNEHNVNGECEQCNCHDPNHLVGYRKNLIEKIGLEAVLELEATPIAKYHKWDRDELIEIIQKYK